MRDDDQRMIMDKAGEIVIYLMLIRMLKAVQRGIIIYSHFDESWELIKLKSSKEQAILNTSVGGICQ